jgi:hypothetical protein
MAASVWINLTLVDGVLLGLRLTCLVRLHLLVLSAVCSFDLLLG